MHFEVLVEDISGKSALEILIPKIIGTEHTFRIKAYKGIGRIPKGLQPTSDPQRRILLDQLPRLICAHGKTFEAYPPHTIALIVVCDLDNRCLSAFRKELIQLLDRCDSRPETYFCIAVEEGEAWYLGDLPAIKRAYPNAKDAILHSYEHDSICGTWEKLANAIYPGGAKGLAKLGGSAIGHEKSRWAEKIAPHMDVDNNLSTSFCYFRQRLTQLIAE